MHTCVSSIKEKLYLYNIHSKKHLFLLYLAWLYVVSNQHVYIFKCYPWSYFLNGGLGRKSIKLLKVILVILNQIQVFLTSSLCSTVEWQFDLIPFLCSWMTLNKFLNLLVSSLLYKSKLCLFFFFFPSRKDLSEIIHVKWLTLSRPVPAPCTSPQCL